MKAGIGKRGLSTHLCFPPAPWVLPASPVCVQPACLPSPGHRAQPSVGQGSSFVPCSCKDSRRLCAGLSLVLAFLPVGR